jgi:hypothetical protein
MNDALREALIAQARELSQHVLDRMYENPFWMQKYGDRGRRFADEDSLFHLTYLDQALAADDPAVFEKYATWLRSVLVSRGMCSAHLAENFSLLAEEIEARRLPAAKAARQVLERGVQALVYTEGAAAALEARRTDLLAAVERAPGASRMREDDRRYLVSYLIDARATGNDGVFSAFAARLEAGPVAALRAAAG